MIIVLLVICVGLCVACSIGRVEESYLRIHIRANSNFAIDQNIKYIIKDEVVDYLTPYVVECDNFDSVKGVIKAKARDIEKMINAILKNNGFDYKSSVEVDKEYFPTRTYESCTLEANIYDAVIIRLGEGAGDNWWCVVYPPLCFKDTQNVVYKSKIMEIINRVFG